MKAKDLCVEAWAFNRGLRAYAPEFSIAVPDGWNVFREIGDDERAFAAYPEGITRDDVEELGEYAFDGLVYCPQACSDDEGVVAAMKESGIEEFVRAYVRMLRDGDDNPIADGNLRVSFTKARDCYVMVTRVSFNAGLSLFLGSVPDEGELGYEIQIIPCMPQSFSYLRLRCPNQKASNADAAFDAALEMAKTVELAEPWKCERIERLEKCKTQKVDAEYFIETVTTLANTIGASRELENGPAQERILRDIKRKVSSGQMRGEQAPSTFDKLLLDFLSDYSERTIHYAFDMLDALQFQKDRGASPDDVRGMAAQIGDAMAVYEVKLTDEDPARQAAIDAMGNVRLPEEYERARDLIEEELPGYKATHDAERAAASVGDDAPNGDASLTDVVPDAAERQDKSYEAWWDPFPQDREPYYAGFNNRFDHAAACWLLYNDILFFQNEEITWDGEHHSIAGVQLNVAKADEVPVLVERSGNYIPAFVEMLMEVEQDEGLVVPKGLIHKALRDGIGEGDLTGITLMNLQALGKAMAIMQQGAHEYAVMADSRLVAGIPDFLNLMGRLIWDLRAFNGVEEPFSVVIVGSLNVDANAFFGDTLRLDRPVAGASTESSAKFAAKPKVSLPKGKEVLFTSGFDNPRDVQADEQLFEGAMMSLMRSFPLTIAIEGTHHLGRAARIEDVNVGDALVLASDWESEFFTPCCIEVFNDRGETLGNLNEQHSVALSGYRELALLLPYITATVESVTPLSKRRKNAKYALMDVRLELDKAIAPDEFGIVDLGVIDEAKRVLRLPKNQRVTMSHTPLKVSDLKGNISKGSADAPTDLASDAAASSSFPDGSASSSKETASLTCKYPALKSYAPDDCLTLINGMYEGKVSGDEFVSRSERIVGSIIQKRQRAFTKIMDAEQHRSFAVAAATQSIVRHNDALLECLKAYLDIIDRQIEFGASPTEVGKMLDEAGEVEELLRNGTTVNISAEGAGEVSAITVPVPRGMASVSRNLANLRNKAKSAQTSAGKAPERKSSQMNKREDSEKTSSMKKSSKKEPAKEDAPGKKASDGPKRAGQSTGASAISKAKAFHEDVSERYHAYAYRKYREKDRGFLPIVEYLFTHGGAADPADMKEEVLRTYGTFFAKNNTTYDEALEYCKKGTPKVEAERIIRVSGSASFLSSQQFANAARELVVPPAVFEQNGRLYLWAHGKDGKFYPDLVARYGDDIQLKIDALESEIKAGKDASSEKEALESLIREMESERQALGLFKGARGKELKRNIAEAKDRLEEVETLIRKGGEAEKELAQLNFDLKQIEKME